MQEGFTLAEAVKVVITAAVPYLELRGAIPLALLYGAAPGEAFILGVAGNLIPIIPIMLILPVLARWADRYELFHRFFRWIHQRTKKQQNMVNRYGFLGLTLFVAIPLPMTGVWTGAAVAYLLGIRKRHAFFALMLGTLLAGMIVTIMATGAIVLWK